MFHPYLIFNCNLGEVCSLCSIITIALPENNLISLNEYGLTSLGSPLVKPIICPSSHSRLIELLAVGTKFLSSSIACNSKIVLFLP